MLILEAFAKYEPLWLFVILFIETLIGSVTLYWIVKEYEYDKAKDDRRQKRTRTTKKTTTNPTGVSVVEESTETSEPARTDPQTETK